MCADQIASLRIIIEQSLEWKSPLYVNSIDYEKAFDSVDRDTLWKILMHYGTSEILVSLISITYQGMKCRVTHAGQMSDSFKSKQEFVKDFTVAISLPSCNRLDSEDYHIRQEEWKVDTT